MRRVTVEDAAKLFGLSENALRERIERGFLQSERVNGIRYALLETDMPQPDTGMPTHTSALMARMSDEIEYIQGKLQRRTRAF